MAGTSPPWSPEDIELRLLLEGISLHYGFDFRNYCRPAIKQRVQAFLHDEQLGSISELLTKVLHVPEALDRFLLRLLARPQPLFGRPSFYATFRRTIVPWLRTYPFTRIWVPGCAGDATAFSLALILLEEGLQTRCRIYATDLCDAVLRSAQAGQWPVRAMKGATANYRKGGGTRNFADYFTVKAGQATLTPAGRGNLVFAAHNLVSDGSFNEFHLIHCQETMKTFDSILQAHVHDLFFASLAPGGLLVVGPANDLGATLHQVDYQILDPHHGIYRKSMFS